MEEAALGIGFRLGQLTVLLFTIFCSCLEAQESGAAPIQPLLKAGDSAIAQGDYDAALRSFEKAQQIAQQMAADSPIRYELLKRLTSASAASGQFTNAQQYLQQAIAWRESIMGPKDPKIADDLLLLVNLNMRAKVFDQALATAQRVEAMHVEAYTSESIPAADDLVRIGEIYLAENKPKEAVHSLGGAIAVRTKLVGSLDPGLLPAYDQIIEAERKIAGNSGTEPVYRQALAIREMLYGENSPALISTVEGLADAYSDSGMLLAAEPLYLRLLALWEGLVGKDHPMIAVVLDKLVVFYVKKGQPEKAREALARSVAIRARFLAVGLSHQAADAISEHRPERAKKLYNQALAALASSDVANEELMKQINESLRKLQGSLAK